MSADLISLTCVIKTVPTRLEATSAPATMDIDFFPTISPIAKILTNVKKTLATAIPMLPVIIQRDHSLVLVALDFLAMERIVKTSMNVPVELRHAILMPTAIIPMDLTNVLASRDILATDFCVSMSTNALLVPTHVTQMPLVKIQQGLLVVLVSLDSQVMELTAQMNAQLDLTTAIRMQHVLS